MADADPRKGTRGRVRFLLIGSLALNLALAGAIGGALLRKGGGSGIHGGVPVDNMHAMQRALAEDDRKVLRKALGQRRGDLRRSRQELRELRGAFRAALVADPFSRDVLEEVLARQSDLLAGVGGTIREVLVDHIEQMTPEARAAFAARLEEERKRRRNKKRGQKRSD